MRRLAISNLALPQLTMPSVLLDIHAAGVQGIEVAPTRVGPWADLSDDRLDDYRLMLADHGLVVSSLASLFFNTEGLDLLGNHAAFERMRGHLQRVVAIGQRLGTQIGVFGSPRNRLRGALSMAAAAELGCERLRQLATTVAVEGFKLVLEPVPAGYGGDFLQSAAEVIAMVSAVDHPGLRVHLDTGGVLLGGDRIADAVMAAGPSLAHFHIAEPRLGPFYDPVADHASAADSLQKAEYDGWLAIEMLEQSPHPLRAVIEAIRIARRFYWPADKNL